MKNSLKHVDDLELPLPVRRLVTSLSKKFRITVCDDVEKAMELAIYVDALGHVERSIKFLESFVFDIEYSEKSGVWGDKCDCLCLLSKQYRLSGQETEYQNIFKIIESKNFDVLETDWLVERAANRRDRELQEPPWPTDLTKKERLLGHFSKIRIFTSYHEQLLYYRSEDQSKLIANLCEFIGKSYSLLKNELIA